MTARVTTEFVEILPTDVYQVFNATQCVTLTTSLSSFRRLPSSTERRSFRNCQRSSADRLKKFNTASKSASFVCCLS